MLPQPDANEDAQHAGKRFISSTAGTDDSRGCSRNVAAAFTDSKSKLQTQD
jgi:hypothetical protein